MPKGRLMVAEIRVEDPAKLDDYARARALKRKVPGHAPGPETGGAARRNLFSNRPEARDAPDMRVPHDDDEAA